MKVVFQHNKIFIFFILLVFLANCKAQKIMENKNISYKEIASGAYGGISEAFISLINNKKKYNDIFSKLNKPIYPSDYPEYLSSKSYIFIIFGQKSSGGLDYKLKSVKLSKDKIEVYLEVLNKANESRIVTTAIANPYIVLEIDKIDTNRKIEIVKE